MSQWEKTGDACATWARVVNGGEALASVDIEMRDEFYLVRKTVVVRFADFTEAKAAADDAVREAESELEAM
jgi:hypothetical protein